MDGSLKRFTSNPTCPFVLFLLTIVLSVLRYSDSDCPFGIFKLFLEVLKILNLKSTDIREITLSPNRQIIKLRISKVSNEVEIAMPWLIDALNDLKQNFPRTIIYCNSITDASKIYTYITSRMFRRHEYVSFKNIAK